jgi:HTH-type transcriptional regulator, sugar sensing transcriptional regulator
MIHNEKTIEDVKRIFDLNMYEARLWLALLSRGISTAGELSEISAVPRSRAYDVLESLIQKKLISAKREQRPVKYIALPPHEILSQVKVNYDKKMEDQSKLIDKLKASEVAQKLNEYHKAGSQLVEKHEKAGVLRSRKGISHQMDTLFGTAKKTLEILATPEEAAYLAKFHIDRLLLASSKGVKIRIAGPFKESELYCKELSKIAEVKVVKTINARIILRDGEEAVFSLFANKDVHTLYDTAVWVHSPYFVKAMRELFNHVWTGK